LSLTPLRATPILGELVPLFQFGYFFFEIHGQGL
jgi:hypothetical protein